MLNTLYPAVRKTKHEKDCSCNSSGPGSKSHKSRGIRGDGWQRIT